MEPLGLNILLVDGAEVRRYAIASTLLSEGFQIQEAATAQGALEFAKEQPDLILLSVDLPDMNGFEVCRRLKANPVSANIPVIEISANFIDSEKRIEGFLSGADDCIPQPVTPEELLAKLRVWARIRQAEAELKRQNARLRQQTEITCSSESRLRAALEMAQLGVWECMRQGRVWEAALPGGFMHFDERCREVLGITESQPMSYESWTALIHPEDRGQVESRMCNALSPARPGIYTAEHRIVRPDGTLRWIAMRGHTIVTDGDSVIRLVGTLRDITERKQSEEELRQSEERYRRLVETATEGIWQLDNEFRVTYVNMRMAEMLGYTREEIVGHSIGEFVPLREMQDVERREEDRRRGVLDIFERELQRKDGSTMWALVSATPLRDGAGNISGSLGMLSDITERKLAEVSLRESEQRLQFHMENTPLAVIEWGPDFRLTRWSGEAEHIFGWKAEEVLGKRLDEFRWVHEDDVQKVASVSAGLLDGTGRRSICSNRNYRKDGSVVYCEWYNSSRIDEFGKCVSILSLVLDVTEQRRAEEALRESEERFRTLANGIPQLCWTANADGWITWYNERWYQYTGTTPEQMEGWGWQSVHDPGVLPQVLERWKASLATGNPFDMVFPLRGADGVFRPFLTRVMPIRDASRKIVRWFGTNTDVAEQKYAEAERDRFAQQRQLALDAARLGWWHYDPVTKIDAWDQRYQEIFGIASQQSSHKEFFKRVHPDDLPRVIANVEAALNPANPKPYSAEYRIRLPNGDECWIEAHGVATFEGEGAARHATSLVGTVADITDRKRAEQLLIRSEKMASLGRLAATIAHEINNPLAAVMNALYLARTCGQLPLSVQPYLDLADEELKRVSHITSQTLGFYREHGTPCLVSPAEVMDSALNLLDRKFKAKNVTVEKEYGAQLHIHAVEGELRQIFSNLLMNGLDAVETGGKVRLRITCKRFPGNSQEQLWVTVADNGRGISPDVREHIFEPLFTTKGTVGTGLGLWVSRELVGKVGGSIRVHSCTDGTHRGTTFAILLPLPAVGNSASRAAASGRRISGQNRAG